MSTQSTKEREQILNLWAERYGERLNVDLRNIDNISLISQAVANFNPLKLHHVVNEVCRLDLQGLLVHTAKGPTVVVVEKPEKKLSKADRLQQAGLGATADRFITTEFDRDALPKRPVLTEEARVALNAQNGRIDEIIRATMSSIARHTGPTHSSTFSRRAELKALFETLKGKVTDVASAETLQRAINEKIDGYDSNNAGWGRVKAPSLR